MVSYVVNKDKGSRVMSGVIFEKHPPYEGLSTNVRAIRKKFEGISRRCVTGHDGPDPEGTGFMTLDGHSFADLADDRDAWEKRAQEIRDHRIKCYDDIMAAQATMIDQRTDELRGLVDEGVLVEGATIRGVVMSNTVSSTLTYATVCIKKISLGVIKSIVGNVISGKDVTDETVLIDPLGPIEIIDGTFIKEESLPLSIKIGRLESGEGIEVYDHPVRSVRTIASRAGKEHRRTFSVSEIGMGVRVVRIDGATAEQMSKFERPRLGRPRDPDSLPGVLRDMEVGDFIEFDKGEYKLSTVRITASGMKGDLGRRYTVNRTPTGCKVTRME